MTRRGLLAAGAGGAAALAGAGFGVDRLLVGGGNGLPPNGTARRFASAPDLHATFVRYTARPGATPGLMFVGPDRSAPVQGGAMVLDGGDLVWFRPVAKHRWATNLQVRTLHGRPALSWWEGRLDSAGYGVGEGVIADTAYRELYRVRGAQGRTVDMHELQITPEGTALFTCTPQVVTADLGHLGGPRSAHVLESVIQEVELSSGRLLMEWKSLQHVPLSDSYRTEFAPFDYLHVNSIDVLPDGDLLVCARNTWCVYKLDRHTGEVIWRLGGKRSDFTMEPHTQFAWAHDARLHPRGRMTIFDDGFDGRTKSHSISRALILGVDERRRRVTLERAYTSPQRVLTSSMGNVQLLPDGHLFVGFGDAPYSTEFAPDGTVLANLEMPSGQHSYRSFRFDWDAVPAHAPAVALGRRHGRTTLFVSWNGATGVARWQVREAASTASGQRVVASAAATGFETSLPLGNGSGSVQAVALDSAGRELGRSGVVRV